jgi:pimeloyl-ACP methyl ester carboxylesterase
LIESKTENDIPKPQTIGTSVRVFLSHSIIRRTEYALKDFPSILNDVYFNKTNPVVIYCHGWTETRNSRSVNTVVDSYLARGGWNVIVVDWSAYGMGDYFDESIPQLYDVGLVVAEYLRQFISAGFPADRIHLVGHSLGGQLVGLVGRTLRYISNYEIQRITALDPAGPGFSSSYSQTFAALNCFYDCGTYRGVLNQLGVFAALTSSDG